VKKPAELTEEQWVTYTGHIAFAVERMNKCLDLIADANFVAGELTERERIIKLLEESECQGEDDWCGTIQLAIRLIKGEQK
jgi:hypothetical protein